MRRNKKEPVEGRLYHWYATPLGRMLMESDGESLTCLKFWPEEQILRPGEDGKGSSPVFEQTESWLNRFFAGQDPGPLPPLKVEGTEFQRQLWLLLAEIPYGRLTTYGELARCLEARTGRHTAARAVGINVGRNPLPLLLPCHRVVGAKGALTGFAGGLWRKEKLLALERASFDEMYRFE